MTMIEAVILVAGLVAAEGGQTLEWRYEDCGLHRWYTLFSGECYHYDLGPPSGQMRTESNCKFCVYRGFKGYGRVTFDYGYPQCVKEASLKTRPIHLLCDNDLRHAYSQTLCCCNKDRCNDLHRSASVPLPPEPFEDDHHQFDYIEVDPIAPSIQSHHVHFKEATDPNDDDDENMRPVTSSFDYDKECGSRYRGFCFDYDYYNCAKVFDDVKQKTMCIFCAYKIMYDTALGVMQGYPVCVINDMHGGTKVSDKCSHKTRLKNVHVEYKCCCKDFCNDEYATSTFKLPYYCTSTSSTPSTSTTTTTTTTMTTTTTTSTTTTSTTTRKTTTTKKTTTTPSNTTFPTPSTIGPTNTSTEEPTTTDTTTEPPLVHTGINCYSLDFNKSVVVSGSCKGCLRTEVYNIEERPFLACLRPHLDPFDIYEQFCDQYFLDTNVLFFVYCCYTDFCNQARTPRPTLSLSILWLLSVVVAHRLRP